jgi:hypothetical protein
LERADDPSDVQTQLDVAVQTVPNVCVGSYFLTTSINIFIMLVLMLIFTYLYDWTITKKCHFKPFAVFFRLRL